MGACASGGTEGPAEEAQALLCPELGSDVDVLELPNSDAPDANGRFKAFVATARGPADAVIETERLAIDSCRRITRDLGLPEPANPASIHEDCAPVGATIQRLTSSGVDVRISLATPKCGPDQRREARCSAVCPASGKECAVLCSAQAALYAQCTLPAVSVAVSSELDEVKKLARSLEENAPALLYAELALGKRLIAHAEQIAFISARLPGASDRGGNLGGTTGGTGLEAGRGGTSGSGGAGGSSSGAGGAPAAGTSAGMSAAGAGGQAGGRTLEEQIVRSAERDSAHRRRSSADRELAVVLPRLRHQGGLSLQQRDAESEDFATKSVGELPSSVMYFNQLSAPTARAAHAGARRTAIARGGTGSACWAPAPRRATSTPTAKILSAASRTDASSKASPGAHLVAEGHG